MQRSAAADGAARLGIPACGSQVLFEDHVQQGHHDASQTDTGYRASGSITQHVAGSTYQGDDEPPQR